MMCWTECSFASLTSMSRLKKWQRVFRLKIGKSVRSCLDIERRSTSGRIPQWLGAGENVAESQVADAKVPCSCLGDRVHRSIYDGLFCPARNQVHRIRSRAADRRGDQQWQDHSYRIATVAWIFDWTIGKEWLDACDHECE